MRCGYRRSKRADATDQAPDAGGLRRAIEKVFYPVFPPDKNAAEVLDWLDATRSNPGAASAWAFVTTYRTKPPQPLTY